MRTRTTGAAVALVALVACSNGPGGGAVTSASTGGGSGDAGARAELEQTVRSYSAAYVDGDADSAVALLSNRCRQLVGAQVPSLVALAQRSYGDARIISLSVDEQSEDRARVTYRYSRPELDQVAEPWVNEGGWRQDNC